MPNHKEKMWCIINHSFYALSKCAFSIRNKFVCLCPIFMTVNLKLPVSILPQIMSHHPISKQLYVHTEGWWENWPSSVPFSLMSHCASLLLEITCKKRRESLYHNPTYPHLVRAIQNGEQTLLRALLSMLPTLLADTPGMASDNLDLLPEQTSYKTLHCPVLMPGSLVCHRNCSGGRYYSLSAISFFSFHCNTYSLNKLTNSC